MFVYANVNVNALRMQFVFMKGNDLSLPIISLVPIFEIVLSVVAIWEGARRTRGFFRKTT